MKLLMLLCLLLNQNDIVVPLVQPPQNVAPQPTAVDTVRLDEYYFIESDDPLIILDSPLGLVVAKPWQQGTVLHSRFAGGNGIEERVVEKKYGYTIRGMATGKAEILLLKAGASDQSDVRRIPLTVVDVPVDPIISPEPVRPKDEMALAFRVYESELRKAHQELANRLMNGTIKSEKEAADWLGTAHQELRKRAFTPLLQLEEADFGGANWTAEKHAAYIRRYAE